MTVKERRAQLEKDLAAARADRRLFVMALAEFSTSTGDAVDRHRFNRSTVGGQCHVIKQSDAKWLMDTFPADTDGRDAEEDYLSRAITVAKLRRSLWERLLTGEGKAQWRQRATQRIADATAKLDEIEARAKVAREALADARRAADDVELELSVAVEQHGIHDEVVSALQKRKEHLSLWALLRRVGRGLEKLREVPDEVLREAHASALGVGREGQVADAGDGVESHGDDTTDEGGASAGDAGADTQSAQ